MPTGECRPSCCIWRRRHDGGCGYHHQEDRRATLAGRPVRRDDERVDVMTKPVRVLIVDDQESYRSAARLVVELADGFEIAGEAASGEDSLLMVPDLLPDLVLMDINMPGIDGLEATKRLLADHPDLKVVVLSTYEAVEYEQIAVDAGAVAFISKSEFGPDALEAAWEPA